MPWLNFLRFFFDLLLTVTVAVSLGIVWCAWPRRAARPDQARAKWRFARQLPGAESAPRERSWTL